MNDSKPSPTLAPLTYEEPPVRPDVRYYDEREFYGMALEWIEHKGDGFAVLHFGGDYTIEFWAPRGLHFVWPREQ